MIFSPAAEIFWPKQQIFLPVTHYKSSQTKCNRYIVIVTVSRIVKSYLGIICTKPSHYSLHPYSYFPKHDRYQQVTVTKNE
jgi:hypothetical protein